MFNVNFFYRLLIIAFLVLLQVFIFDKISFRNIAVPYIYVLFIILYPPKDNRYLFLLLSFLLGFGIDMLEDTGGIHIFASVTTAYLTRFLVRPVSGSRFFEIEEFKLSEFSPGQWFIYSTVLVFVHHFILFFFESFSLSNITGILLRTLYCSLFTLIFVYSYLILFRKKVER